jgi:hypothetical protein
MIAAACYPPMAVYGKDYLWSCLKPALVGALSLAVSDRLFPNHPPAVSVSFFVLFMGLLAITGSFRGEDWLLVRRILSGASD